MTCISTATTNPGRRWSKAPFSEQPTKWFATRAMSRFVEPTTSPCYSGLSLFQFTKFDLFDCFSATAAP